MIRAHVLNAEGFTLALVDFPSMPRAREFARRQLFGTDGRAKLVDRETGELEVATWENGRFSSETPAEFRQGGLF